MDMQTPCANAICTWKEEGFVSTRGAAKKMGRVQIDDPGNEFVVVVAFKIKSSCGLACCVSCRSASADLHVAEH
eukprot:jgi/Botrbrau1/5648/Bobra.55_1s0036.1